MDLTDIAQHKVRIVKVGGVQFPLGRTYVIGKSNTAPFLFHRHSDKPYPCKELCNPGSVHYTSHQQHLV